jgi:hypothetical protein
MLNKNTHAYYQSMPELQSWFHYCKSLFSTIHFYYLSSSSICLAEKLCNTEVTDWLTHSLTHSLTYSLAHSLSWTRFTLPHYLFIPLTSDLNVTPKLNLNTCHTQYNGSATSMSHIRMMEAGRFWKSVLLLFKSA